MAEGIQTNSNRLYKAAQYATIGATKQKGIAEELQTQVVDVAGSLRTDVESLKARLQGMFDAIQPLVTRGEDASADSGEVSVRADEALTGDGPNDNELREAAYDYASRSAGDMQKVSSLEIPIEVMQIAVSGLETALEAFYRTAESTQATVDSLQEYGLRTANRLEIRARELEQL